MKKSRTLRQTVLLYASFALFLPMLIVLVFTQTRIWNIMEENLQEDVRSEVDYTDRMLNQVLERYNTVLYDLCTDDEIVNLVEGLDQNDVLQQNSNQLRRELSHVCNRNEGVEGVTLITNGGSIYFYDRNAASFISSNWADKVVIPQVDKGVVYQGGASVVLGDSRYAHLLQMSRKIIDYRNINRRIGMVVLSIDQEVLWDVIQPDDGSEIYICEGNRVIASNNATLIRRDISLAPEEGRQVLSRTNEMTGWTIYVYYSEEAYHQDMMGRIAYGIVYSVGLIVFIVVMLFFVMNPIMNQIHALAKGMSEVEKGDLTAKVQPVSHLPTDVMQIVDGFNSMVEKTDQLVKQVKESAEEQKNAELSAMEAQIDPHFLYNTLDTINWKAIECGEYEISKMVGGLADILRYSIRNPGETVSIGQELYWLEQYAMLQKEKLTEPLELIYNVPENIRDYRVHKLLLQPFVENAIKHGFAKMSKPCRLEIRMGIAGEQLHIQIKDNGKGIPPQMLEKLNDRNSDPQQHVGVANVRKRLQLYYGEDATVYFESKENSGTVVHLFVKAIRGEDESHENSNS